MANQIILITGGSRSGKSKMAVELCQRYGSKIFIATAQPRDEEMKFRIVRHQAERGNGWETFEEPLDPVRILKNNTQAPVVLDCLTLWTSNMMEKGASDQHMYAAAKELCHAARIRSALTIFVTNEVGLGIVPANPLARRFVDVAGTVNQIVSQAADRVLLMLSGIPLELKQT